MLYFAYGANTNIGAMARRCPNATPLGTAVMTGRRLVFKGCADIIPDQSAEVHGAVWRITRPCERALDRFEGFPLLYRKDWVEYDDGTGAKNRLMVYVMNDRDGLSAPWHAYEQTLREGYYQFDLPQDQITVALHEAEKHEKERIERNRAARQLELGLMHHKRPRKRGRSRGLEQRYDASCLTGAYRSEEERERDTYLSVRLADGWQSAGGGEPWRF